MNTVELLAWVHEDYDRTLILKALDGTAFLEKYRTAATIKQIEPTISPDKIGAHLSGLRQRELIVSKYIYHNGKLRTIYRNGQSRTFADRTKGWRLTNKGAGLLYSLTKA